MERTIRPAILVLLASLLTAPSASAASKSDLAWPLMDQPDVVTLVNLHPDPQRLKLSSVNYQQAGFVPVCTPVQLVSLKKKEMKFRIAESGAEYTYEFHKTMQGTPQAHLEKVFGVAKSCPKARIAKMSKVDQEGIQQGQVLPGMTKDALVIALGYPPEHATPTLQLEQWRYWRNRFNTVLVLFDGDKVSGTQE